MTDFGTPGSFPTPPTPPSSGARTGPPWVMIRTTSKAWKDTMREVVPTKAAVGPSSGQVT